METPARRRLALAALLTAGALATGAAPALAQAVDVDAAKREGKMVWYTSVPVETAQKIANRFEQRTGIKVELFRSGGSAILRRFQQESDAGRVFVDVLTHSEPAAARAMTKKGLFVPFKPDGFDKVPDEVKDPNGNYIAQRLNVMAMYDRDDKLPNVADRPKTWGELVQPKFKGKMVMADPSFSSLLVTVVGMLAKEHGWPYFDKLRANDIMLVAGNQQVADMVKRGERLIAVGADAAYVAESRKALSISVIYPEDGAFLIPSPSSVVKGSPHPNAAKAFAEFMLSKPIQELFPSEHLYSARTDVAGPDGSPPLSAIKVSAIDYDYIEAESTRIKRRFSEALQ